MQVGQVITALKKRLATLQAERQRLDAEEANLAGALAAIETITDLHDEIALENADLKTERDALKVIIKEHEDAHTEHDAS